MSPVGDITIYESQLFRAYSAPTAAVRDFHNKTLRNFTLQPKRSPMNYTYIVQCADGTLYTGWTNCLEKRLKAHNSGKNGAKYTKTKRPVTLVYYEGYATKEEAMSREYAIKQLTRAKKLALMEF